MLETGDLIFVSENTEMGRPSRHLLETIAMWPSFWTVPFIMPR